MEFGHGNSRDADHGGAVVPGRRGESQTDYLTGLEIAVGGVWSADYAFST
ncbi:MAG TPA: hypothetical protein VJ828_18260 [Lacipirellulaceae bacterium]|nr:hypothetical protein [Lacipirellulaceae bacterium]